MGQFFKLFYFIPSGKVIAKCMLTEHRFRKGPGEFQRDVIPGASAPYAYIDIHLFISNIGNI